VSALRVSGLDWDKGNWPKCNSHGVSKREIEEVLRGNPTGIEDPYPYEPRFRAVGQTKEGRYVFIVYVERIIGGVKRLRPLSARYMHKKEVMRYAETKKVSSF